MTGPSVKGGSFLSKSIGHFQISVVLYISTSRGCSSMVELQPSKLTTWVRFPSPAPDIKDILKGVLFVLDVTLGIEPERGQAGKEASGGSFGGRATA